MKTKRLSLSFLLTMSAVILIILLSLLLTGSPQLWVASAVDYYDKATYDEYTDSDVLYGERMLTIRDYPEMLYNSTASIREGFMARYTEITVYDDDPILQIIPLELFANRGECLHIGKEYGFFVK